MITTEVLWLSAFFMHFVKALKRYRRSHIAVYLSARRRDFGTFRWYGVGGGRASAWECRALERWAHQREGF